MSSKNQYLVEENQQLREQVEQLQHMLRLNKQALQLAMENNPQQNRKGSDRHENNSPLKQPHSVSTQSSQNEVDKKTQALNKVISSLYEENNNLANNIQKLTEERNVAQGKSLIYQQMYEETLRQKQELVEDMNYQINSQKEKNRELEDEIHKLEKEKPVYDQISGVVVKFRQVVSLNEQTILMHEEQERLNYIIVKQAKEISKLRKAQEDLTKINFDITQQLIQQKSMHYLPGKNNTHFSNNQMQLNLQNHLQTQLQQNASFNDNETNFNQINGLNNHNQDKIQVNFKNQVQMEEEENPLDKSALILMNLHKKIMDGGQSDSDDDDLDYEEMEKNCLSPMMSPLPDKVQNTNMNMSMITNQVNGQMQTQSGLAIKQLDLTRAFQIQDLNAKRSTQIQLQKQGGENNINLIKDKLKKAEANLDESRKNLAREMLLNKTFQLQNDELSQTVQDLEGKNDILINSYSLYEQKWKDVYHAYSFYKDFYKEYKEDSGNRKTDIRLNTHTNEYMDRSPERIIRDRKKNDRNMDLSILDPNLNPFEDIHNQQQEQYEQFQQQQQQKNVNQMNDQFLGKQQAQDYLMGMAANLYANYAQPNKNNATHTSTTRRIQRSNSNPIDNVPVQEDMYKCLETQSVKKNMIDANKSTIPYNQYNQYPQKITDFEDIDEDKIQGCGI